MLYFDILATELLRAICSHLDSISILRLCEINDRVKKIYLYDKRFVSKVNLANIQDVRPQYLTETLSQEPACELITHLNITSVRSISSEDIQKSVRTMVNLEELGVMDTNLEFLPSTVEFFQSLSKVSILAVSRRYGSGGITEYEQYFGKEFTKGIHYTRGSCRMEGFLQISFIYTERDEHVLLRKKIPTFAKIRESNYLKFDSRQVRHLLPLNILVDISEISFRLVEEIDRPRIILIYLYQ